MYIPGEIIVVQEVLNEPVTRSILEKCPDVPVRIVKTTKSKEITEASTVLSGVSGLAERITAGKKVLVISGTTDIIKPFVMPDPRMGCPHFVRLVQASNGCPYLCDPCYLRLTYRDNLPFIVVRVRYDEMMKKILRFLKRKTSKVQIFNMGELQDGLALEHLTGAAQVLIPFFGHLPKAYLFILTKCDDADPILRLRHNERTILAWSLNAPEVSAEFEIGAPTFERRLRAARRAQDAGYPIRIRLDPGWLLPGWRLMYGRAINRIFAEVTPERVTLGILRFEKEFFKNRHAIIGDRDSESRLLAEMERMEAMLPPMEVLIGKGKKSGPARTKISIGKYSYPAALRVEFFHFAINEIRKYFKGPIALCKEIEEVWNAVGLDPKHCRCVCQYDEARLFCGD